jgi:outer membrane receptor protein involved in Fe transport
MNVTLIGKKFIPQLERLELRGSVYNLFDLDYTVPTARDGLPVDFPMPGRSFLVDLRYMFE